MVKIIKILLLVIAVAVIIKIVIAADFWGGAENSVDKPKIDVENFSTGDVFFEHTDYNYYFQEDKLFAFKYKNDYEVRVNKGIYFLSEINTGNISFQIFEKTEETNFDKSEYKCVDNGKKEKKEVCYSLGTLNGIVKDLEIFPDFPENWPEKYTMFTRGEALKWALELAHPNDDFSEYADNCFADVSRRNEFSGYICYAKNIGMATGIDGKFFWDRGVNLWGFVKFLFYAFDFEDRNFDATKIDPTMFDLMTPYHLGYTMLAKAYFEGIFNNEEAQDVWPNRVIYKDEALRIVVNFLDFRDGKILRKYDGKDTFKLETNILIKDPARKLTFDRKDAGDFKEKNLRSVILKSKQEGLEVYFEEDGGIYEFLHVFPELKKDDIKEVKFNYNEDKFKADILFEFEDGGKNYFELDIGGNDFAYLKEEEKGNYDDKNVMPNKTAKILGDIPQMKIYMKDKDFAAILRDRTIEVRYPAYLEIVYPSGYTEGRSVTIKTRGNANRGYVKSSFTIESFKKFEGDYYFIGDEFLDDMDEFKLRSMISDDTMIKEKLTYGAFRALGYPEPEFFSTTIEINGIAFGLYQATEPIKDEFFERRHLEVSDYFYALNITSPFLANLVWLGDEDKMRKHYGMKGEGNEQRLFDLVKGIAAEDFELIGEIDTKNVFDYALLAFFVSANDSVAHNYYLYFDENDKKWRMFFWDADAGYEWMPLKNKNDFKKFTENKEGHFNNLIHFVFKNMSEETFDEYWDDFWNRWEEKVDLSGWATDYVRKYGSFFEYDNRLWKGKFLEEKDHSFNTVGAINELRGRLSGR